MKHTKKLVAVFVVCLMLITPALAHEHEADGETEQPSVSLWAQAEIEQAAELGLIPSSGLPMDYSSPLTREELQLLAMQYLAVQNHTDLNSFYQLISYYLAEKNEDGEDIQVFSDGSLEDSYAYAIGLMNGVGDNLFDPDRPCTRQEASVVLMRSYIICGGVSESGSADQFADADAIADWAIDSVATLTGWGVIQGMDNGKFEPEGTCTVEQGIVLFLRLYQSAPVSGLQNNVSTLFSYEQCSDYLNSLLRNEEDSVGYRKSLQIDGPDASFVRLEFEGVPHSTSSFYLIHREGGIQCIDLGICNLYYREVNSQLELENPHFTDDGLAFTCTVSLESDVPSSQFDENAAPLHEKGIYEITLPVYGTGTGTAEKIG